MSLLAISNTVSNTTSITRTRFIRTLMSSVCLMTALFMSGLSFAQEDVLIKSQSVNMSESSLDSIEVVDINTADVKQLASLTNVGVKKAQEIIQYRQVNGLFVSIDDLKKVKGIGSSTIEKNRHRMHVASN